MKILVDAGEGQVRRLFATQYPADALDFLSSLQGPPRAPYVQVVSETPEEVYQLLTLLKEKA